MFNQILLGVDGSGRSREMMNMLLPLPSMARAQINILHVVPWQVTSEGLTEYRLAGERILAKEAQNLKLGSQNTCVQILKEGEPKDVVCQVAAELKPDLLIMGSRGMGRLQSILANSVSQYVFQLTSVPMLLIKDDVYIKSVRRVMVALNKSAIAAGSLESAISLIAGQKDIEIVLLRIGKQGEEVKAETDESIQQAIAKLTRLGIPHRLLIRQGEVGKEICRAVEEANPSLLVLGSPDRRPSIARSLPDLDRLLGNSVSDYVRVNASCPVLLTRNPEPA
ncbi:MAG: universal stress protein [Pseudanabaenaceae cyanobacterium bins.68]|nr:universal stress protein [Pseudanabaenaceae cyanobacterium bins.68]